MIMTEVSAVVAADRADDVPVAFDEVLQRPLPDGLIRTELLAGRDGERKVQTVWRDQAALDAMRAGPQPPAAPAMFRQLGAEPVLRIYQVRTKLTAPRVRPNLCALQRLWLTASMASRNRWVAEAWPG